MLSNTRMFFDIPHNPDDVIFSYKIRFMCTGCKTVCVDIIIN